MEETLLVQEEICSSCKGEGYKLSNNLVLYEFCPKCKGKGRVDWITNVVSNQSSDMDRESLNLKNRFTQHNIQELTRQIIAEYGEIGISVGVEINYISPPTHSSHIHTGPSHTGPSHTHNMPISNTFKLGV